MGKLTWKNYYDFSLLSYFDVYDGNETVEEHILSILLDSSLIEAYKHDVMFQMNIQSVRQIEPSIYRHTKIIEVFDDNLQSGVYLYRLSHQDQEVIAIRGSEEYDDVFHKTAWQDWRDNFDMYVPGPTLQQLVTLHYMHGLPSDTKRTICGHSKGGNLAVFTALTANLSLFNSIAHVYAFNAPGITDSLMEDYEQRVHMQTFLDKITLIENEHDCISAFFHHVKPPHIIASNTPANSIKQLYENHQLHTMVIEEEEFTIAHKKSTMPKLVHHFINDFFVKQSPERIQRMVDRLEEYFNSGLSKSQLYRVLIYQVSKYTNVFDELSYDEVANITFKALIERRKTRIIYQFMNKEQLSNILQSIKVENPLAKLNDIDMKDITSSFISNYELMQTTAGNIKQKIFQNNKRIMDALSNIQNRGRKSTSQMVEESLEKEDISASEIDM